MAINVNRSVLDPFYRYKMPKIVVKERREEDLVFGIIFKTVIANMSDVAKALDRPPSYLIKYMGHELGAQTNIDLKNDRYIVNGAYDAQKLQDILDGFIRKFVLCPACDNPETALRVRKNLINSKCKACGHAFVIDSKLRLASFIVKNPPQIDEQSSARAPPLSSPLGAHHGLRVYADSSAAGRAAAAAAAAREEAELKPSERKKLRKLLVDRENEWETFEDQMLAFPTVAPSWLLLNSDYSEKKMIEAVTGGTAALRERERWDEKGATSLLKTLLPMHLLPLLAPPLPLPIDQPADMEGLVARQLDKRIWKDEYMVLRGQYLRFFSDAEAFHDNSSSEIPPLNIGGGECSAETKTRMKHVIRLVTSDPHTEILFSCKSEDEMQAWLEAIRDGAEDERSSSHSTTSDASDDDDVESSSSSSEFSC